MRITVILTASLLLIVPAICIAQEYLQGQIVDQDGNVTNISRIKANGWVSGTHEGRDIKVPYSALKRIENLGNRVFRLTNKADAQFQIENAITWTETFGSSGTPSAINYYYYDPISQSEQRIRLGTVEVRNNINTITFSSEVGRLKYNPKTKQFFPPDYIFDPFSGEKLVWKNP